MSYLSKIFVDFGMILASYTLANKTPEILTRDSAQKYPKID